MQEPDRVARNREKLQEAHPAFRHALAVVIARLQAQGYRPRIQQCWRSPEEQETAFLTGHSRLRWGYHNATTSDHTPDALAADVLDDDHPLEPTRAYILALARAARAAGLDTGIGWGLPPSIRHALDQAIDEGTEWTGHFGWDANHVETTAVTVADARMGKRPGAPAETVNV